MNFEWDQKKNAANYAKHEISFELASQVFDDPLATYILDRVIDDEERWHAIGRVLDLPLLVVVHTYRNSEGKEIIRILSARQATSHERKRYEQEWYPAS
ncbi:MAG: BrnT family toxin [Desulfovibrio sp.]|jgi:uncharacterized DUF497 family protein|nr:BrnT family toxin [Desulfovibrio sp.]